MDGRRAIEALCTANNTTGNIHFHVPLGCDVMMFLIMSNDVFNSKCCTSLNMHIMHLHVPPSCLNSHHFVST
jgi:hypothetical protein